MINHEHKFASTINSYSKDSNGAYLFVNQTMVSCFMLDSAEDILGRRDNDLPCQKDHVAKLMENDRYIIQSGANQAFIETGPFNGFSSLYRSFKSAILGRHGKIIGVQGVSIPVSEQSLIPLTKQQLACLKQLALGQSHKQIASNLGLSQKTVEHYLDTVKLKLNCRSRAELIMQAIQRGLIGFF